MPRPPRTTSPLSPKLEYGIERRRPVFKRERFVAVARVLVWVVPLTILIWIWAEREQVLYPNSPNVTNVPILITSSNSQLYIEPSTAGQQTVNLKISGPQEAIDRVRQALFESVAPRGITIDIGNSMIPGDHQPVDIVSRIQDMAIFKQAGVTVEESQPKEMRINVDTRAERTVIVQAAPDVSNLSGAPVFDPPKVTVTGPGSVIKNLEKDGGLKVYATLPNSTVMKPGDYGPIKVGLSIDGGDKLRIDPVEVSARFTVRQKDETYTIRDGIPISVDAPVSLTDAYRVIVSNDASIADTTVVGPPEKIELIRKKEFFAKASLEITNDDIGRPVPKPLVYTLPEGVRPTEESQRRVVEFKIVKRDNGG